MAWLAKPQHVTGQGYMLTLGRCGGFLGRGVLGRGFLSRRDLGRGVWAEGCLGRGMSGQRESGQRICRGSGQRDVWAEDL